MPLRGTGAGDSLSLVVQPNLVGKTSLIKLPLAR